MPLSKLEQKKDGLANSLQYFNFDKKYFIHNADARIGSKFALASKTDSGGIQIHTSFMTFEEFNAWFMGYLSATNNRL